jgi:hypothetical protein
MKSDSKAEYTRLSNGLMNLARPTQRHNYTITDFFSNYEEIHVDKMAHIAKEDDKARKHHSDQGDDDDAPVVHRKRSLCRQIKDFVYITNINHWIFLVLMAVITTILSIAIDIAIKYTSQLRRYLCIDLDLGFIPSLVIWTTFTLFFTMIAASVGEFISKDAEGSGIPEMKSILAGVNIYRYLSFQTVIGKVIGLYSGFAAGLAIGKEGPFVHLAGGITNKLCKLGMFSDIKNNHSLK